MLYKIFSHDELLTFFSILQVQMEPLLHTARLSKTPTLKAILTKALGRLLLFNLSDLISMLLVQGLLLHNGETHHFPRNLVLGRLQGRLLPLLVPRYRRLLRTVTIGPVLEEILKAAPEAIPGLVQVGIMTWQLMAQSRGHHTIAPKLPTSIRILAFRLSP